MKHMTWIVVAALAVGAAQVNAAEEDKVTRAASGDDATMVSQADSPSMSMKNEMVRVGKTRAEVRQELIQAEKDGSLARLNALLYNGS